MIGEKIKEKRSELNMTQEYLANKLSISRQAISKWEKGLSEPSMDNLEKLSEIFGVDISYFKNAGKDEKDPIEEFKSKSILSRIFWYILYYFISIVYFGFYYLFMEELLGVSIKVMPYMILTTYFLIATLSLPRAIISLGDKLSDIDLTLFRLVVMPVIYIISPFIVLKYIVEKER